MTKKIIIAILSFVFLAVLVYSYFNFSQIKSPVTNALDAIPPNAALVIKINNAKSLINKINDGNIIWEELISTDYFASKNNELLFIDSLLKNNISIKEIIDIQYSYLSFHKSGAEKFNFLFTVSIPPYANQKDIHNFFAENSKGWTMSSRSFNGVTVINIKKQDLSFNYCLSLGVLLFSPSSMLIEEAINQIKTGTSISENQAFKTTHATAGTKVNANFFINYEHLNDLLSTFLIRDSKKASSLSGFANWAALDLNIKPNALMLNGFSFSYDTLNNYVNLFGKQKPQNIELTRILPSTTSNFTFFGFSNFSSFHRDYKEYRKKANFENEQDINQFNTQFGLDAEFNLLSWISNEVAVGATEPESADLQNNAFAVFSTSNLEIAKDQLSKFQQKEEPFIEEYKDFEIKELPVGNAFELLLGNMFSDLITPFYTNIGKYIIVGNNPSVLKVFINEFLAERTLIKDVNYSSFSENISTQANIYVYSNIARSTNIYSKYLNENYIGILTNHKDLLRKFEAIAFQVNNDNKLFYNNFYLKYNPVYKQQTKSLWETQLDSTVSSKPSMLLNHLNGSKEIFVQDDANIIYLISNTGKILWKKQLEEKIISDIHQVDLYKNEKLQLLFNTSSKLYLLDRNGDKVDKYPVVFKEKATSALSLFDYDNNLDYRILIPQSDNKIYNYSGSGEMLKGFSPVITQMPVNIPVQHLSLNGKDYVIAVDSSGKVYIFDRKGDSRINLKEKLNICTNLFIEKGKDLSKTYLISTDSSGIINKLNLMDELEKINLSESFSTHHFDYKDITGDKMKEFVYVHDDMLNIFNQNKDELFKYKFKNNLDLSSQYFYFPDGYGKTGITDKIAEEIYLFDERGNLFENFPLKGTTLFSIGDINQDNNLNIVVGSGRNIYLYQIRP
ncbi:MAG: DUF3352 domain-containing protein [Bacteroidota bacterium]|nr:DUF3352 domain-containing protein [Bacteroidota bacterium]